MKNLMPLPLLAFFLLGHAVLAADATPPPPPLPVPAPIRQGTAHVYVSKSITTRTDKEFDSYAEAACDFTHAAGVYDLRLYPNGYGGWGDSRLGTCDFSLNGETVTIYVLGDFSLIDTAHGLRKYAAGNFYLSGPDKNKTYHTGYGMAGTEDPGARSIIATMEAESDLPADAPKYETVSVNIEFEDPLATAAAP